MRRFNYLSVLLLSVLLLAAAADAASQPRRPSLRARKSDASASAPEGVAVTRSGRLLEKPIGKLPNYKGSGSNGVEGVEGSASNGDGANGDGNGEVPIVDPPKRVAGYFRLNRTEHDGHMFYLYFASRAARKSDPVVLWMTGGPGCSSEIAVFYENGPYALTHNLTLVDNRYGWDANAHMVFVDQPINTGFSYSRDPRDYVTSEATVAEDMLEFLWEFFEAHPELAGRDFYVTGESYAGHYAPAVASRVYRAKELGEGPAINLAGVAIGNGLTMPGLQFGAYADYAFDNGLISERTRDSINWWMAPCRWGASLCNQYKWGWLCGFTLQYCEIAVFQRILASKPGINVYDIRKDCVGPLCYDFSDADAYLNSASVRQALGVAKGVEWTECNMLVHAGFWGDFMLDYGARLVPLLEDGVRVMIYAGDKDLICNHLGNRRWVDALEWAGKEGWAQAEDKPWSVGGRQAGTVATHDTLSFVRVFDAGHMVPLDQPKAALAMISSFVRGRALADGAPAADSAAVATAQAVSGAPAEAARPAAS